MDAIKRYERAREAMEKHGIPILPEILTGYVQALREAARVRKGLHRKVIIITRDSSAENLGLFRKDTIAAVGVDIEVRS